MQKNQKHDQFQKITEKIKLHEAKIRDNCNVISQLKKEDVALRITIKLLKRKRFDVAIKPLKAHGKVVKKKEKYRTCGFSC